MRRLSSLLSVSLRHTRLISSLAGLLAVVIVMGACSVASSSGTTAGKSVTATATIPGSADDSSGSSGSSGGSSATATTALPTATPTNTPTSGGGGGIICCLTYIPIISVHQVFQQQTLAGTNTGPVTASCPAGETALSGGWASSYSDGANAVVFNSTRNGSGGWRIYVEHSGSTVVNTYVLCLKNASGATVMERYAGSLMVNPNTYGTKFASCNAGETLVGGGFAGSGGVMPYNFTASGSSWGGYAWNTTGSAAPFSFYAECLTYAGSHSSFTAVAQATGHTTSAACPSGSYVSGGGFAGSHSSKIYTMSATSSGQAWEVYDAPATLLNAYGMCVSF